MRVIYSNTVEECAAYRLGWSRIWGSGKGGIYLLPSETSKVIVQTLPDLKISCVLPPAKRRLSASYDKHSIVEIEVDTPTLLFQQVIIQNCTDYIVCGAHGIVCFCEKCVILKKKSNNGIVVNPSSVYYLFELLDSPSLNKPKDRIFMRPFRMANVHPGGSICIGWQQQPKPTLRQTNFNFWNSSFNNDFSDVYEGMSGSANPAHRRIRCPNKGPSHSPDKLDHARGNPHFKPHTAAPAPGSSLTRCRKQLAHKCSCLKNSQYHKGNCPCFKNCVCPCVCPCCMAQCLCACQCLCCRKFCNCRCQCDPNEVFARQLQGYKAQTVIDDYTNSVCGSQFMASSKKTEGVFISCDKDFIKEIPERARSQTKRGTAAIGLALLTKHGEWRIDFRGGYSTTLTAREVYLV